MKTTLIIFYTVILLASLAWAISSPSWEPCIVAIGSVAALIERIFFSSEKKEVIVASQPLTNNDVKEIAADIFKMNILQLKNEAMEIAMHRASEITEKLLIRLKEEPPVLMDEFRQPGLQEALFIIQKEYAKSGDKDIGDLLIGILVDRAAATHRDMYQIIMDEALSIAPKLTIQHLDTLTLMFILKEVKVPTITDIPVFAEYISEYLLPFIDNLSSEKSTYKYLEYLGCGDVKPVLSNVINIKFKSEHIGLFQNSFTLEEFEQKVGLFEGYESLIMRSLHAPDKYQLHITSYEDYRKLVADSNCLNKNKLIAMFSEYLMTNDQVIEFIQSVDSKMNSDVFKVFHQSFGYMELTSVGIAIAHANYRRKTNRKMDLSIWIN